jgi:hypothetical protein
MRAADPSETFASGRRAFLSERGQTRLLLLAVVLFAVSIALALAFSDARVHRSPVANQRWANQRWANQRWANQRWANQRWHEAQIGSIGNAVAAHRARGAHVTIMSPSSPTTSA